MDNAMTERIPLSAVRERADQIDIRRVLLTLLAGTFWAAGWSARMVFRGLALLAAAVLLGWHDAGPGKPETRSQQ